MKGKIKIRSMSKRIKRLIVWLEVALAVVLFSSISIAVFQIEITDLIKYLVFQICGIFVPGFMLLSILKRELPIITRVCLAYSLGYALNIVEYFIGASFDRQISYLILSVSIFTVSLALIFFNRKKYIHLLIGKNLKYDNDTLLTVSMLLFLLSLNVFTYACRYKDPFAMPHDMSWWVNNSVALKLDFPPDNLFMSGTKLHYHYFSSMQIAYCSLVTGIDVVSLSIPLYVIPKTVVMIGAVDFCLEVMDIHGWKRFWGTIVILFTTGMESDSVVTFFHHILLLPFGFDIGFAFGIYFLSFLFLQWKKQEFDQRILLLTTISWMICVGAKAPIAAVLLLFPGSMCIYWLVKKRYLMGFTYGICILGSFILISIGCVGLLSVVDGDSGSYYLSIHSIDDLRIFAGKERPIILAVLERWIAMEPTIFVLILLALIDFKIFKKGQIKTDPNGFFILTAFVTYLWGIFLWRIVSADGSSEMYYGMAAYIPAYFVIGCVTQCQDATGYDGYKCRIENGVKISACLLGTYFFMFDPYGDVGAIEYARDSIHDIKEISLISSHEMDGLRWIRDNTDRDAVIVSDSSVLSGIDTYYFYGIISERQQYIEGTHMLRFSDKDVQNEMSRRKILVQGMYDNDPEALERLRDDGVEYIVQTISITPQFQYDKRYIELVATSDNVNVYKIK